MRSTLISSVVLGDCICVGCGCGLCMYVCVYCFTLQDATSSDRSSVYYREIDFEVSYWNISTHTNHQFTMQPGYDAPPPTVGSSLLSRYSLPLVREVSHTCGFEWRATYVFFFCVHPNQTKTFNFTDTDYIQNQGEAAMRK